MSSKHCVHEDAVSLRALLDSRYQAHTPKLSQRRDLLLRKGLVYTVDKPIEIVGSATFGGRRTTLQIHPASRQQCRFSTGGPFVTADVTTARSALHNIRVGDVRVTEHLLALAAGMNFAADFVLNRWSVPSFYRCLEPVLDAVAPHLKPIQPVQHVTAREPFAVRFENGAYAILLPDNGAGELILDHQFEHKKNCLGQQRISYTIEPSTFATLASARPMSYGLSATALGWARRLHLQRIPLSGFYHQNFVMIGRQGIWNADPRFNFDGNSREPILHELVDKCGALALLGRSFLGTVVTSRTSHAQDLIWVRHLSERIKLL